MATEVDITSERVDDIPLLVAQQRKMGIAEVIDGNVKPHWHRQGLSVGETVVAWLAFILSEADHRLSYVEPWVARHPETLKRLINRALTARDFSDDRLGAVLRYLSDDPSWTAVERELGQRTLRVYQLPQTCVRLDSTTVAVHHDPEGSARPRSAHSKNRRPDLAQLKMMLATLDPLGLPVATQVVPGNAADDGLYIPAVDEVRAALGQSGLLYIGDSKMEALQTRAHIVAGGDYYLTPLSAKGAQAALLAELVQTALAAEDELVDVYREPVAEHPDPEAQLLGQGREFTRLQEALVGGELVEWTERVLAIYSPPLAQSAYRGLQGRLQRAEEKLLALTPAPGRGKRQFRELAPLQEAAEKLLQRYRLADLLQVSYTREVRQRQVRKYKDRPARTEETVRFQIAVRRDEAAIEAHTRALGWRLYVLNAPADRLSLAEAVRAYRGAPNIERDFSRLKGRPLGLRPVYVQREDHLKGLVRLLSLALRVLTLTEFVVRRALGTDGDGLAGLYPGNPKQQSQRPTTERLLRAFKDITLSVVRLPDQIVSHLTPLTPIQSRILKLLDLPLSIYTDLAANALPNPP